MLKPSIKQIKEIMVSKGYTVYTKPYVLNIVGIRSALPVDNSFNDCIAVFYVNDKKQEFIEYFPCTTTPGQYWLRHPMNKDGCAIICEGQYIDAYTVGKHRGYTALEQIAPVEFVRDNNRNVVLDYNSAKRTKGVIQANIHRANETDTSTLVDKWSAGCQVISKGYTRFITRCILSKVHCNNRFTYTLINEKDFF